MRERLHVIDQMLRMVTERLREVIELMDAKAKEGAADGHDGSRKARD